MNQNSPDITEQTQSPLSQARIPRQLPVTHQHFIHTRTPSHRILSLRTLILVVRRTQQRYTHTQHRTAFSTAR